MSQEFKLDQAIVFLKNLFASRADIESLTKLKTSLDSYCKALTAGGGGYDAAPSTLTGGAALMTESLESSPKKKKKKEPHPTF